jgi:hypothetical protein
MAIGEWELWACANEMVRRHGADATLEAALKADSLFDAGDLDGSRIWRSILRRIERLQRAQGPLQ